MMSRHEIETATLEELKTELSAACWDSSQTDIDEARAAVRLLIDEFRPQTQITEVKIYWDTQDQSIEAWAYVATSVNGLVSSGGLPEVGADDLDGAIEEAVSELGLDLTPDMFAREPVVDGGYAIWTQ